MGFEHGTLAMSLFGPRLMQSQPTTDSPPVRLELQYPKRPQTTISDTVSLTVRRDAEGALVATVGPDTANVIATLDLLPARRRDIAMRGALRQPADWQ